MFIMSINNTKIRFICVFIISTNKSKIYKVFILNYFLAYTRELHKFRFNNLKKM